MSSTSENTTSEVHSTFQEVFDHFLIFCEKTLQHNSKTELLLKSRPNIIYVSLDRYRKVYNKTRESSGHLEKFREIYNKCRSKILNDELEEFMEWFREQTFKITPTEKSKSVIHITVIFRNCCRMAEEILEKAERTKDDSSYSDPAFLYPESFMLHLFRIFYHCADETDRTTIISKFVEKLESTLDVTKGDAATGDGLNDLFSAAQNMARGIGLEMPKDTPSFSGKQFRDAIKSVTTDPQITETIKDVLSGVNLNDPSNIPTALSKLVERMNLNAKEVPPGIQKSLDVK